MKYNSERDHTLILLVNEFEKMSQKDEVSFIKEKDFHKLILYYERELLFDKAIEVVDYAIGQHGFSADLHIRKAELFLALRNSEQALTFLDMAEAYAPCEPEIQLLRAKILCSQGEYGEALQLIEKTKINATEEELSDIYLSEAQVYETIKNYNKMFDCLKKSLAFDSDNEEALEKVWVCTELTKKYNESIRFHQKLIDQSPYSFLAWYNLGHAYSCRGKYEEAIEAYEYSYLINEEFELGYRECADLCFQTCQYEKAMVIYFDALEFFGPDSDLLSNLGECYLKMGSYLEAKEYFSKASKLDPYNDEVYYFLGLCYSREDRWLSAVNSYFKAIELEDRREEYFCALAKAFYELKEFTKAHYYFQKATELGPELTEMWSSHAKFLINIEEFDQADEVIREGDFHAGGAELIYCRAALDFLQHGEKSGLETLHQALIENVDLAELIFEIVPSLRKVVKVNQLIDFCKAETIA